MSYGNICHPISAVNVTGLVRVFADIDLYRSGHRHPGQAADATGLAPSAAVAEAQAWDALDLLEPPWQAARQAAAKRTEPVRRRIANLGGRPRAIQPWRPGDPKPS